MVLYNDVLFLDLMNFVQFKLVKRRGQRQDSELPSEHTFLYSLNRIVGMIGSWGTVLVSNFHTLFA